MDDSLAVAVAAAIRGGDVDSLKRLLADHPGLATAVIASETARDSGIGRTLLHVATDWPGNFPNDPQTVAALVEAGADVNGRFTGPHIETPLHWAASSDDVSVIDALLDAGADIEEMTRPHACGVRAMGAIAMWPSFSSSTEPIRTGSDGTIWPRSMLPSVPRQRTSSTGCEVSAPSLRPSFARSSWSSWGLRRTALGYPSLTNRRP